MVSGLHTSINCHILEDMEKNPPAGLDFDAELARRLGVSSPGPPSPYVSNLYFSYMLLLTALKKATPRLLADCGSGSIEAPLLPEVLAHPILELEDTDVAPNTLISHAQ